MRITRIACITALCSIALVARADGQSIPWMTRVRLVIQTDTIEGRIESVDSAGYRIRIGDDYKTFRRGQVSEVLRFSTSSRKGALIGAIGGLALGGPIVNDIAEAACEDSGCTVSKGGIVVGDVLAALAGAAIGGMLGSTVTKWTRMPARFEVRYVNGRAK